MTKLIFNIAICFKRLFPFSIKFFFFLIFILILSFFLFPIRSNTFSSDYPTIVVLLFSPPMVHKCSFLGNDTLFYLFFSFLKKDIKKKLSLCEQKKAVRLHWVNMMLIALCIQLGLLGGILFFFESCRSKGSAKKKKKKKKKTRSENSFFFFPPFFFVFFLVSF